MLTKIVFPFRLNTCTCRYLVFIVILISDSGVQIPVILCLAITSTARQVLFAPTGIGDLLCRCYQFARSECDNAIAFEKRFRDAEPVKYGFVTVSSPMILVLVVFFGFPSNCSNILIPRHVVCNITFTAMLASKSYLPVNGKHLLYEIIFTLPEQRNCRLTDCAIINNIMSPFACT